MSTSCPLHVLQSTSCRSFSFHTNEAEQFIERQIRRKIQYRWILRQNSGEELPLPSGPIPALKTHRSISGSVTTTATIYLWCLYSIGCGTERPEDGQLRQP